MTSPTLVTITNNGTMLARGIGLLLGDLHDKSGLESQTWECLYSGGKIFVNEPMSTVEKYGEAAFGNLSLAPGASSSYTIVYYAGAHINTGCGSTFTGYSATPLNGFAGQYNMTEPYPAGTVNPAAASLTNSAENGTIAPTVTVSYVGVTASIRQVSPFGNLMTVPDTGSTFIDRLAVTGSKGVVIFSTTAPNSNLHVSSGGVVTTVNGPLATGTYTVSGTDYDSLGDTGSWSYALVVTKAPITCPRDRNRNSVSRHADGEFYGRISVTGARGTVIFSTTSPNSNLHVSSGGVVTTMNGPLATGTYTVSGTDCDSLGDTGSWSYILSVTK